MAEFKLQLEPAEKIVFVGKKLGEEPLRVVIKMTNPLAEKIAYKVKCTSNEMFRIRPPVGCVKAGESASVNLTFQAGKTVPENGKHYFAIYYIKTEEKKTARAAWADHKGEPDGTKRLYMDFNKEDGALNVEEKKDDKKEDDKKDSKKEEKKDDDKKDEADEKKEENKEDKKEDEKKD